MTHFDFDEWAALYKASPVEFERKRNEFLNAEIDKAPAAHRANLRSLQAECDDLCGSLPPLDAVTEITKLMVDKVRVLQSSFLDLGDACNKFSNHQIPK